jgi:hypothetical protein
VLSSARLVLKTWDLDVDIQFPSIQPSRSVLPVSLHGAMNTTGLIDNHRYIAWADLFAATPS